MGNSSKTTIKKVWGKAKPIKGKNPDVWRKDSKGNKIRFGSYGTQGKYGWEIDHKRPQSKVGVSMEEISSHYIGKKIERKVKGKTIAPKIPVLKPKINL